MVKRVKLRQRPNFVAMSPTAAGIWRFFDFSIWRPPLSWIFKFMKILTVGRSRGSNCVAVPNLVEIGQTAADMAIFRFLKMAAAAVLDI